IGNQESQNNIAAMLASHGVSAHNVSCASIDAGETVCRKLTGASGLNVGVYGVSSGAFLALHLEAATGRMRPTVASGYMRDEKKFAEMQAFYRESAHPHLIDMYVFDVVHEASGKGARPWLYSHLASPAYQEPSRLKNAIAL